MTIKPGSKVLVADPDARSMLVVYVTTANLAACFTGVAFSPATGAWLPQKLYAYEMIAGLFFRLDDTQDSPVK